MRVSEGFRLYGSSRCVMSRRVRFLSTDESFSGLYRKGDVSSVGSGL